MAMRTCWPVLRLAAGACSIDATAMSARLFRVRPRTLRHHAAMPVYHRRSREYRLNMRPGSRLLRSTEKRDHHCIIIRSPREKQSMPIYASIPAGRTLTLVAALMLASALPGQAQQPAAPAAAPVKVGIVSFL